eukprot:COSAG01_NODE_9674_length_2372_cov_4.364716_5_plen_174_part_01
MPSPSTRHGGGRAYVPHALQPALGSAHGGRGSNGDTRGHLHGAPKHLAVESPWSPLTSECQHFDTHGDSITSRFGQHGGHSYASSDRAAVVVRGRACLCLAQMLLPHSVLRRCVGCTCALQAVAEAERDVTTDFAEQLRAAGVTVPVVGVGTPAVAASANGCAAAAAVPLPPPP